MLVGLLADSHGRATVTANAVALLVDAGAELLLFLGDVGTAAVLDALVADLGAGGEPRPPVHVVFGNTDGDIAALAAHARRLGLQVDHPIGRLTLDGKRVVFLHGDDSAAVCAALDEEVEFLFHGHTHQRCDERAGATRVVNPGALHRARQHTVAVVDVGEEKVRFLEVPRA